MAAIKILKIVTITLKGTCSSSIIGRGAGGGVTKKGNANTNNHTAI
jgi:hypothetical protein